MVGGRWGTKQSAAWNSLNVSVASEDCLYLNVFTPTYPSVQGSLPVMVWLHAGEFRYGTSQDSESDWPHFSGDAVILVTINFRLGVPGFAALDELRHRDAAHHSTGNYGMQDQRAALQWVWQEIKAFNGDPNKVTIFGESSGGTCVGFHLTSRASRGFFSRAILESPGLTQSKAWDAAESNTQFVASVLTGAGSDGCVWPKPEEQRWRAFTGLGLGIAEASLVPLVANASAGKKLCATMPSCGLVHVFPNGSAALIAGGVAGKLSSDGPLLFNWTASYGIVGNSIELRLAVPSTLETCLVRSSPSDLVAAAMGVPFDDTFRSDGFGPTEDGVELSLPLQERARGPMPAGVAVLSGSNLDEGTEFMDETPPLPCNASAAQFDRWAVQQFGPELGSQVWPIYRDLELPTPKCQGGPNTSTQWLAAMRAAGDAAIGCRSRELLIAAATARSSAWRYLFKIAPRRSVNWPATSLIYEGAFHGAEVPFVFGDQFELSNAGERAASLAMGCWWRNFAATGDPNTGPTGCTQAYNLPAWPPAGTGGADAMVIANATLAPRAALNQKACDLFAKFP